MNPPPRQNSAFAWNAGAWLGMQWGSTLWMLILGAVQLSADRLAGGITLAVAVLLNGWGWYLWRQQGRLPAYQAMQRFLAAATVGIAGVVVVSHLRFHQAASPEQGWAQGQLPVWVIGMAPILMLFFAWRERNGRRVSQDPAP